MSAVALNSKFKMFRDELATEHEEQRSEKLAEILRRSQAHKHDQSVPEIQVSKFLTASQVTLPIATTRPSTI